MLSLYDFDSYKVFLQEYLISLPRRGHGEKSRIAAALQCQSAYFSQVLNGNAELSLEQGDRLATYLALNEDESEFLLLLIDLGRAGTSTLKQRLKRKLQRIKDSRVQIKNRIEYRDTLSLEDQTEYYRSTLYGVVHLMVGIPALQSKESLLKILKIPPAELNPVLDFLIRCGLIESSGGKLKTGRVSLHLSHDSKLIKLHHANWRLRAIESMSHEKKTDLHYSSAISISSKDVPKIREILLKSIEQIRKVVKDSAPEDCIYSYGIDLFELYEL